MRLFIKQKVFSWRQRFNVYDEAGNAVFSCAGKILTLGKKLYVYDSAGAEAIYIRQRLLTFMPRYEIHIKGVHAATLVKKFTFFSHDFRYEGLNWKIDGDFWAHNYCVTDNGNGETIMTLTKKWLSWGDTYCMDINDRVDPLICLASGLVIDCICHEGNSH